MTQSRVPPLGWGDEKEEETINSQEPIQYEKKLIHNTKEYFIAEMDERKRKEMAKYVLHQELIHFH